jgi:hypothetical protein
MMYRCLGNFKEENGGFLNWEGVPPNHPFIDGMFHEINHPFGGTTIYGNPQMMINQDILRLGRIQKLRNLKLIWVCVEQ